MFNFQQLKYNIKKTCTREFLFNSSDNSNILNEKWTYIQIPKKSKNISIWQNSRQKLQTDHFQPSDESTELRINYFLPSTKPDFSTHRLYLPLLFFPFYHVDLTRPRIFVPIFSQHFSIFIKFFSTSTGQ